MSRYIATFYSHFGAIRFSRELKAQGIEAVLTPVPRQVSSSCGTCARFQADDDGPFHSGDVEHIFRVGEGGEAQLVYSSLSEDTL